MRKVVALWVTITFFWLLQLSAMPLQASTAEANSQEQSPGMVEKVGKVEAQPASAKKGSILPYVLIGLGAAAVAALLIFVVFKPSYDITGTWNLTYKWGTPSTTEGPYPAVFTGTKESGTMTLTGYAVTGGVYTVDGKKVTFSYTDGGHKKWEFVGEFKSKTRMEGAFNYYWDNVIQTQYTGTFIADKV